MCRCEVARVSDFIRHLATNYISRGYFFYVKGEVPSHKEPRRIDERIIEKYGINISKWTRARRRKQGHASVQYLRCRHRFVILATHGEHHFFRDEGAAVQDIRRVPFKLGGYSVSYRERFGRGFVSVRIDKEIFAQLKEYLLKRAQRASTDDLINEILSFSFPSFGPVRRQLFGLLRDINQLREAVGLESIRPLLILPQWSNLSRR